MSEEKTKKLFPFNKKVPLEDLLSFSLMEIVARSCLTQLFSWARYSEKEGCFAQGFARGVYCVLEVLLKSEELKEIYVLVAPAVAEHPLRGKEEMEEWLAKELVGMVEAALRADEKANEGEVKNFSKELEEVQRRVAQRLDSLVRKWEPGDEGAN